MNAVPMRRIDAPRRRRPAVYRRPADGWPIDRRERRQRRAAAPMARRDGHIGMSEAAAVLDQQPLLRVVPRRRVAVNVAAMAIVVLGALMLAAVLLHTQLAERQLEIDRLGSQLATEQEHFAILRHQRAELRSPARLQVAARDLGMVPAMTTTVVEADPGVLARVLAATGTIDSDDGTLVVSDPLDQVRRVRAAESGVSLEDEE